MDISQKHIIIAAVAIIVVGIIMYISSSERERFRFQEGPVQAETVTRPQGANPDLKAPLEPRFDAVTQGSQTLRGAANPLPISAAPATPTLDNQQFGQPDFTQLGGQAAPLPSGALTTKQVDDILSHKFGTDTPKYQETVDLMPVPDMRYSAGVDPTDPQAFMYDRTIFSRLKRRYGNEVDFFRGDIDVRPQYRGWFDIQPPTDIDVQTGYFNNYISADQELNIKDATFERATPVETLFRASVNPMGNTQKLAYSTL
jgi:hypothetical protein